MLAVPPNLSVVYNVFHVSILRKYPIHVIAHESLPSREDLTYEEESIQVLARKAKKSTTHHIQR